MLTKNFKQLANSTLALLLLFFATSCTKESGEKIRASQENVKIDNNVSVLSGRLISYLTYLDTNLSPSPLAKSAPNFDLTGAKELKEGFDCNSVKSGESYLLKAGQSLRTNLKMMKDLTFYVAGRLSVTQIWGDGACKIIVLPGGELTYETDRVPGGLELSVYGKASFASMLNVAPDATVYFATDFQTEKLHIGGTLLSDGVISLDELSTYQGAKINFNGCASVSKSIHLTTNSELFIGESLTTKTLDMSANSKLLLNASSLVKCDFLSLQNPSCGVVNLGDKYSVIQAGRLQIHQNNVKKMFLGWLDLHYDVLENNSGAEAEWLSNIKINGDTYIAATSCSPGFGTPPAGDKEFLLNHIAELKAPSGNVSATGITYSGKYAYVSWHTYGDDYGGYIDIIDVPQRQVRSSISSEVSDFNHVMVSGDNLWTTGGTKSGAFAARLPLGADGLATVETLEKFLLQGSTGKCLLPTQNSILTASGANGAYQLFDQENLTLQSTRIEENAKYLDKQGSRILTLSGVQSAKVSIYREEDLDLNKPIEEFTIGNIDPSNGKNVIRMDGNRVYVAMGFSGVKAFENGVEVAHYATDAAVNGAANGLDYDDNYIYVAEGNAGITVLKKSDLSHVLTYRHSNASANFVTKGRDGLIYVAYGKDGVHSFELVEKLK